MSDVLIRTARLHEVDAVGALTVEGYDANGYLTLPDGTFDHAYGSWLADGATRARDGVLMVAVSRDDELLGTVTWCPPGSPFRELATRDEQGEIRTLSVSPAARGRGVGAALTDWCLAEARRAGLSQIVLSSLPEMTPAHRLYATRGFVRRPELDWHPFPEVLLWAFALDLHGSAGATD